MNFTYKCLVCNANSFPRDYCSNCCPIYCTCGGGHMTNCAARLQWIQKNEAEKKLSHAGDLTVSINEKKELTLLEKHISAIQVLTLDVLRQYRARLGDCGIIFVLDLPSSTLTEEGVEKKEKERLASLKKIAGALIFTGDATLYSPFSGTQLVTGFADMSADEQKVSMRAFGSICIVQLHCRYNMKLLNQKWKLVAEPTRCTVNNATGEIYAPNDVDQRRIWFKKSG